MAAEHRGLQSPGLWHACLVPGGVLPFLRPAGPRCARAEPECAGRHRTGGLLPAPGHRELVREDAAAARAAPVWAKKHSAQPDTTTDQWCRWNAWGETSTLTGRVFPFPGLRKRGDQ